VCNYNQTCSNFFDLLFNKSTTFKQLSSSKLEVGPSAKITEGLFIKALAILTLCCSPCDNCVVFYANVLQSPSFPPNVWRGLLLVIFLLNNLPRVNSLIPKVNEQNEVFDK